MLYKYPVQEVHLPRIPHADLEGDRRMCRDFRHARATYEKLLALTDGASGIREVSASNFRGDNPGSYHSSDEYRGLVGDR